MRTTVGSETAPALRMAATSGLMGLTGQRNGPPLSPPDGLVAGLDRLAAVITRWSAEVGETVVVDWPELLTTRAQILGLRRQGRRSPNGSCRLLPGPDGWVAVNLARPADGDAVLALTGDDNGLERWQVLEQAVKQQPVAELADRARLLGMPVAVIGSPEAVPRPPWSARPHWAPIGRRLAADLTIVDLSSMWAGPLTAMLVGHCGGTVVKVESASRPDGARAAAAFYRTLHAENQHVVTLDFGTAEGRQRLRALLDEADVVIESSRPRALEQLGAGPEQVAPRAGRVWVSITGYGRAEPGSHWVAFGDDAAAAGGLVAWEDDSHPVFCGDALADPVTGLSAAAGLFETLAAGGGVLLDVSMQACAAALTAEHGARASTPARRRAGGWQVVVNGEAVPVREPFPAGLTARGQPGPGSAPLRKRAEPTGGS